MACGTCSLSTSFLAAAATSTLFPMCLLSLPIVSLPLCFLTVSLFTTLCSSKWRARASEKEPNSLFKNHHHQLSFLFLFLIRHTNTDCSRRSPICFFYYFHVHLCQAVSITVLFISLTTFLHSSFSLTQCFSHAP